MGKPQEPNNLAKIMAPMSKKIGMRLCFYSQNLKVMNDNQYERSPIINRKKGSIEDSSQNHIEQ